MEEWNHIDVISIFSSALLWWLHLKRVTLSDVFNEE